MNARICTFPHAGNQSIQPALCITRSVRARRACRARIGDYLRAGLYLLMSSWALFKGSRCCLSLCFLSLHSNLHSFMLKQIQIGKCRRKPQIELISFNCLISLPPPLKAENYELFLFSLKLISFSGHKWAIFFAPWVRSNYSNYRIPEAVIRPYPKQKRWAKLVNKKKIENFHCIPIREQIWCIFSRSQMG